jgi:tRNA (mo5U34)-methyltransferase
LKLARLQQRIDQIRWYHDLDFPNGLEARAKHPNAEAHRKLWGWMRSELDKIDFAGKTVLDIGCWDGYWSFYAERRGASRVLATDDKTQNWGGSSGLALAKELMGSSIETRTDVSIYEVAKLKEHFDIILCMGVYYHLVDPFLGLSQVRHCAHERSVVVFEGNIAQNSFVQPQQAAYLNLADLSHCFIPTLTCLRQMLEANYFRVSTESTHYEGRILATCAAFVVTTRCIIIGHRLGFTSMIRASQIIFGPVFSVTMRVLPCAMETVLLHAETSLKRCNSSRST